MYRKAILILAAFSLLLSGCSLIDRFTGGEPTATPQANQVLPVNPYPAGPAYPEPVLPLPSTSESPYPGSDQPASGENPPLVATQEPIPLAGETSPLEPLPNEDSLQRAQVYIDTYEVVVQKDQPGNVLLKLGGSLPTPCHHLRAEISKPDKDNKVMVKVYSLVDPNEVCNQVVQPFESQFSLGTFKGGNYTVYINGEKVGKFSI
jgi:hypothetical protein